MTDEHPVLESHEPRREEPKLWHRPVITVIDVAEETRSNSGPGSDGVGTHS